jgi:hypothetical protein
MPNGSEMRAKIDWDAAISKIAAMPQPVTKFEMADELGISAHYVANNLIPRLKKRQDMSVKVQLVNTGHGQLPARYTIVIVRSTDSVITPQYNIVGSNAPGANGKAEINPTKPAVKVRQCTRCKQQAEDANVLIKALIVLRRQQAARREETKWAVPQRRIAELDSQVNQLLDFFAKRYARPVVPRNHKPFPLIECDEGELNPNQEETDVGEEKRSVENVDQGTGDRVC